MRNAETRLVVVGPLPPPVGGVETVTQAILSNGLRDFTIKHCDLTKRRAKEKAGKLDLGNVWWALIHFWRLLRILVAFQPQAVYMPLTATWVGFWRDCVLALLAKLWRSKVIGHVHGGLFHEVLAAGGFVGWAVRCGLRCFDTLLVLGRYWQRLVLDYPYSGNVLVVPPTLRQELLDAAHRFQRCYEKERVRGLYVGHVGIEKGVLDLLEALHLLKATGKPSTIVFVGPPQQENDWEIVMNRREALDVADVAQFVGMQQGEALFEQFRTADYLVLPSYIEGLPVVFLEAGAFGLPVIGTPVGAVTDLLTHEENGLLVKPGSVSELAAAIDRLAKSSIERVKFGCALRQTIANYSPEVIGSQIADSIRTTLGARVSRSDRHKAGPTAN